MGSKRVWGACQKAPFPGLGILFPSPIQSNKTTQSCDTTRRLSKTVKVASIRLLEVEKKIIPSSFTSFNPPVTLPGLPAPLFRRLATSDFPTSFPSSIKS